MKIIFALLIVGGLLFWGYSVKNDGEPGPERERSEGSSGIGADYVRANIEARHSAERTVSVSGLNQTIRQFQTMEGRFPEDLEELVTEGYMPELPSVPRGQKLDYNPETGEVAVVDR